MKALLPRAVVLAAVLGGLAVPEALADTTLRIGQAGEVSSADPHYQHNRYNNSARMHVFEALASLDNRLVPQPLLAASWKAIDPTTWEFKLRPDVKFSNGTPFTAEDVLYSLCRIPEIKDTSASFSGFLGGITSVTAPDPLTVVIKTSQPNPQIPTNMSYIGIMSAKAAQSGPVTYAPGACTGGTWAARADFDNGKIAIGTGPYKLLGYARGKNYSLERNAGYWGAKPAWDRVELTSMSNDAERVAALIAGDVDMIENPGIEDLSTLESDPSTTVASALSTRIIFLNLDTGRDATPGVGGTDNKNPLKDVRVREAISKAINRSAIVKELLKNQGVPVGQPLTPGLFGYNPAIEPVFDPAAAKALLADAGYANGFDLVLQGSNDRYINDDKVLETVASMLKNVGIRAVAKPEKSSAFLDRMKNFDFTVLMVGLNTPNADFSLKQLVSSRDAKKGTGAFNFGHHTNPQIDELAAKAVAVTDDAAREKQLSDIMALVAKDYGIIPLHAEKVSWALRKGLAYTARVDQYTLANDVKPAQ